MSGPPRSSKRGVGPAGSRLRIQQYVHAHRAALEAALAATPTLAGFLAESPEWRSPIAERDFVEFRDELWKELNLPAPTPQEDGFWPRRGPQWDAVASLTGANGQRGVLLVEAKAHLGEDMSAMDIATPHTVDIRLKALAEAKAALAVPTQVDWSAPRYQLANRITFLYYLRMRRKLPAWLALVYFVGDQMPGRVCPSSSKGWSQEMSSSRAALALPSVHPLSPFILDVFLEVRATPDRIELAEAVPPQARGPVTKYWLQKDE